MVHSVARHRLKILLTLPVAVAIGTGVALGVRAIPLRQLEAMVVDSGLFALTASAEPPLGTTARLLIEGTVGTVAGLVAWLLMLVLLRVDRIVRQPRHIVAGEEDWDIPVVRRADAHPDAPPRPPLRANRDLGTPFLEIRASQPDETPVQPAPPIPLPAEPRLASPPPEQELPRDWDQPLAAFDPDAIPSQPIEPPVRPTRIAKALSPRVFNPYERIETFELTPTRPVPPPVPTPEILSEPPEPLAAPETDATIQALLARLERGLERKGYPVEAAHPASAPPPQPSPEPAQPEGGLQDTLAYLRKLAARG